MAETGKHNLEFVETRKSFWKLRKAGKAPKDNEKSWKPENQKTIHGKLEKAGISCENPETDTLLPPCVPHYGSNTIELLWEYPQPCT